MRVGTTRTVGTVPGPTEGLSLWRLARPGRRVQGAQGLRLSSASPSGLHAGGGLGRHLGGCGGRLASTPQVRVLLPPRPPRPPPTTTPPPRPHPHPTPRPHAPPPRPHRHRPRPLGSSRVSAPKGQGRCPRAVGTGSGGPRTEVSGPRPGPALRLRAGSTHPCTSSREVRGHVPLTAHLTEPSLCLSGAAGHRVTTGPGRDAAATCRSGAPPHPTAGRPPNPDGSLSPGLREAGDPLAAQCCPLWPLALPGAPRVRMGSSATSHPCLPHEDLSCKLVSPSPGTWASSPPRLSAAEQLACARHRGDEQPGGGRTHTKSLSLA